MEGNVWRPTHLTSEQMEERRVTAATLLRQGQLSQAEIARHGGVSRASVCRWAATLAQGARAVWPRGPTSGRPLGSMRVAPCKRVEVCRLRWRPRQSLASSREPSLAWRPVTAVAKRRQGGCRPE
jgi:hypothetical protein